MKIPCPNCNQRLDIPEELFGQTIKCGYDFPYLAFTLSMLLINFSVGYKSALLSVVGIKTQ